MTDMDAKEILRREYYRVVDRLGEVDPVMNPRLYKELLTIVENLAWHVQGGPQVMCTSTVDEIIEEVKSEPKLVEPEPEPAVPEMDEPEEEKTYTKEEVRAALAKSRKNGTNVAELLQDMGYDNFTAVPAAKYGELMLKLENS